MNTSRILSALVLMAALAAPSYAQTSFTETLSVTLTGQFAVTRTTSAGIFNAVTLNGTDQTNVPLNFATAPVYNVVCTNGSGWNCQLSLPGGQLSTAGPGAQTLAVTYRGGTGSITAVGSSPVINSGADLASPSGTLAAGTLKTVSSGTANLGSWNYRLGGFQATSIPANKPAGTYTNTLTVTFSNAP